MTEIVGNLTSIPWWFTAVVVAIIVNLISSYLRDGTDWVWRYTKRNLENRDASDGRARRVAESNAAFVEQLKTDESLRRFLVEAEIRARLLSVQLVMMGLALTALGVYLVDHPQQFLSKVIGHGIVLFSIVILQFGIRELSLGHGLSRALLEVERSRSRSGGLS